MLRTRPIPVCTLTSVTLVTLVICDESKKAFFSGDLVSFLVCAPKFIWVYFFLFTYVCMCHTPIRTWSTSELRPFSPRAQVHDVCVHSWSKDGVSNDPESFPYVMKTYERACAHTKASQISWQRGFSSLGSPQNSWTCSFKHTDTHDGPGRTWNCSVCALGYDSMLSKQIQMLTPGLLGLLHLNIPSYLVSVSISWK